METIPQTSGSDLRFHCPLHVDLLSRCSPRFHHTTRKQSKISERYRAAFIESSNGHRRIGTRSVHPRALRRAHLADSWSARRRHFNNDRRSDRRACRLLRRQAGCHPDANNRCFSLPAILPCPDPAERHPARSGSSTL